MEWCFTLHLCSVLAELAVLCSFLFGSGFNACQNDPCLNGAGCVNAADTYACNCVGSFSGQNCESKSIDGGQGQGLGKETNVRL